LPSRAKKAEASEVAGENVLDSIARPAMAILGLKPLELVDSEWQFVNNKTRTPMKYFVNLIIEEFELNIMTLSILIDSDQESTDQIISADTRGIVFNSFNFKRNI
jgi:hypothetical protein